MEGSCQAVSKLELTHWEGVGKSFADGCGQLKMLEHSGELDQLLNQGEGTI